MNGYNYSIPKDRTFVTEVCKEHLYFHRMSFLCFRKICTGQFNLYS